MTSRATTGSSSTWAGGGACDQCPLVGHFQDEVTAKVYSFVVVAVTSAVKKKLRMQKTRRKRRNPMMMKRKSDSRHCYYHHHLALDQELYGVRLQ